MQPTPKASLGGEIIPGLIDSDSPLGGVVAALGFGATDNGRDGPGSGDSDGSPSEPEDARNRGSCKCRPSFERPSGTGISDRRELVVDASNCPGDGDLARNPACRETVISALTDHDVDAITTKTDGRERAYTDETVGLLLAAGRFVERVEFHDPELAERARGDPLGAAHRATGRAGAVARIAAESGLADGAARLAEREPRSASRASDADGSPTDVFRAFVGPTVSGARVSREPPPTVTRKTTREVQTGATVCHYETPKRPRYHLRPVAHELDAASMATLAAAYDLLANGSVGGGPRAAGRAVRRVASDDDPVETLSAVLDRHTRGLGVFEHFFADEPVSDVVVSAPVSESPVSVVVDGERVGTNVRLTPEGAASLASRFRRESGRAFSRSSPTLDASVVSETGRQIRVAGVTAPASDGIGFAFRARDDEEWTLTRLVATGSLSPTAAAALSLAVERGAATIVAGTRGAGKTTLLGALLWELPGATRVVTIEDTPELPVGSLRDRGRDVQALHTDSGSGGAANDCSATDSDRTTGRSVTPTDALRSALRLGDGAIVVGEVRGQEAGALYEAMRVGAHGHAVLGTIHGDCATAVRERVVSDLGVPASSFGATDLVVTCARDGDERHVAAVEEVRASGERTSFTSLFEWSDGVLRPTGVLDRGDSALFERLRTDGESHGEVLSAIEQRATRFDRLAAAGLTAPEDRTPTPERRR